MDRGGILIEFDGIENNRTPSVHPFAKITFAAAAVTPSLRPSPVCLSVWRGGGSAVHLPFPISISWIWIFADAEARGEVTYKPAAS